MPMDNDEVPQERDTGWYADAVVGLCRAVDDLHRRTADRLGISASELTALRLICAAESITPGELAAELDVTSGSVTPILNHLDRAGYVHRVQHPTDRRRLLVSAKPGGHHALAWAAAELHAALRSAVEHIAASHEDAVAEFLVRATGALDGRSFADLDTWPGQPGRAY